MNKTSLVPFIVGQKISGINPQCLSALAWEQGYFPCFSTFLPLVTLSPKIFEHKGRTTE